MDLSVRLFGRLEIRHGDQPVDKLTAIRVQELFVFLLLFRNRLHTREYLAELLWPNTSGEQSMKYLRHTLWQLQDGLGHKLLDLDAQWVSLSPDVNLWLDVVRFDEIIIGLRGIRGTEFDKSCAERAKQALSLYRGALFDGCYRDWCIVERERLQHLLLHLLDKLIGYCEQTGNYEAGLDYCARALQIDMAHERIHRRLMRLHSQAGNRSAAIRQFEQCVTFLEKTLDTKPSDRTIRLYENIRKHGQWDSVECNQPMLQPKKRNSPVIDKLLSIQSTIGDLQTQLKEVVHSLTDTS